MGGNLDAIPLFLPPDQLVWQDLDHRAVYFVSSRWCISLPRYSPLFREWTDDNDAHSCAAVQDGVIGTHERTRQLYRCTLGFLCEFAWTQVA